MESKSEAYRLVEFVWKNNGTESYLKLNSVMSDAVMLAISSMMRFNKDDFTNIYNDFRGWYWFGVNSNGKGSGECFYSTASKCKNISACQSYESHYDFKPFISKKGTRSYQGMSYGGNLRYRVTGFDFDKKTISLVGCVIEDWEEKGSRKLFSFNNKEWLEFRKTLEE